MRESDGERERESERSIERHITPAQITILFGNFRESWSRVWVGMYSVGNLQQKKCAIYVRFRLTLLVNFNRKYQR